MVDRKFRERRLCSDLRAAHPGQPLRQFPGGKRFAAPAVKGSHTFFSDHFFRYPSHIEYGKIRMLLKEIRQRLRNRGSISADQGFKAHPVHADFSVPDLSVHCFGMREVIGRQNVVFNLMLIQNPADLLHRQVIPVPVPLRVIKYGAGRHMLSPGKKAAHPLRILHEPCKIREFRVISPRIVMGRTVGIRIFRHGEGVGYQIIDSLRQEMFQQVLHVAHAEIPSVGAEQFRHRPAFLFRIQMPCGRSQPAEDVMEKFTVCVRHPLAVQVCGSEEKLSADVVDACHMLAAHGPEIMCGAHAEP